MTTTTPDPAIGLVPGDASDGPVIDDLGPVGLPRGRARRPVTRLVLLLLAVLLVLVGLRLTGAVAPQATLVQSPIAGFDITYDPATGWGFVAVEIRNDGALPLRVHAIELPARDGIDDVRPFVRDAGSRPDGRAYPGTPAGLAQAMTLRAFEPFELRGSEQRELVLLVHMACRPAGPTASTDPIPPPDDQLRHLAVEVRSATGVTERVHLRDHLMPQDDLRTSC